MGQSQIWLKLAMLGWTEEPGAGKNPQEPGQKSDLGEMKLGAGSANLDRDGTIAGSLVAH